MRGGVALEPWSTNPLPAANHDLFPDILRLHELPISGFRTGSLREAVLGSPRESFRGGFRVPRGGCPLKLGSSMGIWEWIWGSQRGDFAPNVGLEVMIFHLRRGITATRGITAAKAKVSLSLSLSLSLRSLSLSLSLSLSPLIASEERNAPRIASSPSGASVGCFSGRV